MKEATRNKPDSAYLPFVSEDLVSIIELLFLSRYYAILEPLNRTCCRICCHCDRAVFYWKYEPEQTTLPGTVDSESTDIFIQLALLGYLLHI